MAETETNHPVVTIGRRQAGTVRPGTIGGAANIAVELRQAILMGDFLHSEKLPPERSLAETFGASRNTVREALRLLEEDGMVSRRIGSGTYVTFKNDSDRDEAAEATSPLELIDAREGIEPQMVRLAVKNASNRDIDRLEVALLRLERSIDDYRRFSRADEAFHLCLAECSRNPMMVWLYRQVNEVRGNALWYGVRGKILTKDRMEEYNNEHRALFDAIRLRNMEDAMSIITRHMNKARADIIGVTD